MSDQKTLVLLDPEGANIDDFVAALTEGREEEEEPAEEDDDDA